MYFAEHIVQSLVNVLAQNAQGSLPLNALMVTVEEVSHFQLLVQRLSVAQPVTQLELEMQAEVDKILVAASFNHQHLDQHDLGKWQHAMFVSSRIISDDVERYTTASRYAQDFWISLQHLVRNDTNLMYNEPVLSLLRTFYLSSLQNKLHLWKSPCGATCRLGIDRNASDR